MPKYAFLQLRPDSCENWFMETLLVAFQFLCVLASSAKSPCPTHVRIGGGMS